MRQYDMDDAETKQELAPKHYEWHEVFYQIFTQPRVDTFSHLLQDPQAKAQRAYLWMLLPYALNGIASQFMAAPLFGSDWLAMTVFGAILGTVLGMFRFVASGWMIQRFAVFLGGDSNAYGKFHYARGSYMPVMILAYSFAFLILGQNSNILTIVVAGILGVELMLTSFALRAVNQTLPWSQIVFSISIWYFLIILVVSGLG